MFIKNRMVKKIGAVILGFGILFVILDGSLDRFLIIEIFRHHLMRFKEHCGLIPGFRPGFFSQFAQMFHRLFLSRLHAARQYQEPYYGKADGQTDHDIDRRGHGCVLL